MSDSTKQDKVVGFPTGDHRLETLREELDEVLDRHTRGVGVTYAAVIGILESMKYDLMKEWKGE